LLTYTMVPIEDVDLSIAVKLENPLNENMAFMRTTMENSLNKTLEKKLKDDVVKVFELAKTYRKDHGGLPYEDLKLGILNSSKDSVFQLKEVMLNIFKILNISNFNFKYESQKIISIRLDAVKLGEIRIKQDYSYLSLYFSELVNGQREFPSISFSSKYATIVEDLTIHVPIETYAEDILKSLRNLDNRILDISYKNEFIKEEKRAVTITLKYQDENQNITNEDASVIRNTIIDYLENELNLYVDRPK
ncbi:hypothetical protein ACFL0C_01300, partial [Patescibacteria group bacterium]